MPARHRSRQRALQVLFSWDQRAGDINDAIADYYATLAGQTLFRDDRGGRPGEFWGDLGDRAAPRRAGAAPAWDSVKAWKLAGLLEELDVIYGRGEYPRAAELIGEIAKLEAGR